MRNTGKVAMNTMAIFPTFLPCAFLVIYMSAATVIIQKVLTSLKSGCEEMFYFCHFRDKDTVAANIGLWCLSVTLKTSKRVCNLFACVCYCFKLTITR